MFNWHYCPIYYYLPRAWEIWRWRQVNFWHNSRGQCWWCRTNTGTNRNQHRNWFRCWFWCWCVRSKVVCHFFIHRKRGTGQRCENAVVKSFKVAAAARHVRVVPRRNGQSRLVSRVPIIFVSFVCLRETRPRIGPFYLQEFETIQNRFHSQSTTHLYQAKVLRCHKACLAQIAAPGQSTYSQQKASNLHLL